LGGGVLFRKEGPTTADVEAVLDVGADVVVVLAELCANCEYECVDPVSELSILDRGEEVLPVIDGR
jgi:hypothetical protein